MLPSCLKTYLGTTRLCSGSTFPVKKVPSNVSNLPLIHHFLARHTKIHLDVHKICHVTDSYSPFQVRRLPYRNEPVYLIPAALIILDTAQLHFHHKRIGLNFASSKFRHCLYEVSWPWFDFWCTRHISLKQAIRSIPLASWLRTVSDRWCAPSLKKIVPRCTTRTP